MYEQSLLKQFAEDMVELHKCATFKQIGERVSIKCKLGLWEVEGPNDMSSINEAMQYFEQYKNDGNYAQLLNS